MQELVDSIKVQGSGRDNFVAMPHCCGDEEVLRLTVPALVLRVLDAVDEAECRCEYLSTQCL